MHAFAGCHAIAFESLGGDIVCLLGRSKIYIPASGIVCLLGIPVNVKVKVNVDLYSALS